MNNRYYKLQTKVDIFEVGMIFTFLAKQRLEASLYPDSKNLIWEKYSPQMGEINNTIGLGEVIRFMQIKNFEKEQNVQSNN